MVAAVMDKRKIPSIKRKGCASNKKDIKKFGLRGWEKLAASNKGQWIFSWMN